MKKVSSILIFLATWAIFGIGVESFAKNRTVFSAQANQPPAYSTIEEYRVEYEALGGSGPLWIVNSPSSLEEARILTENLRAQIANYRKIFGSGDQTWTGFPWTGIGAQGTPVLAVARNLHNGAVAEIHRLKRDYLALGGPAGKWIGTYDNPLTTDVLETTPTLSEAQTLHGQLVAEIARLKTEYLARGGLARSWTGSYDNPETTDKVENTPTLSEAKILLSGLPAKSKPQALVQLLKNSESSQTLIIGLTVGIGGALLLGGGLGYWFYRRRQKS